MANKEDEERNITHVIEDIKKIWPISLLFPQEEVKVRDKGPPKKTDDDDGIKEPKPQVIGINLDPGIDQGLGLLHFVLKFDVTYQILKVIVLQGKNLVGKDPRGTSDPYAEITFQPRFRDEQIYKTEVKMKTLNPVWNHVFVFLNFTEDDLHRHQVHITLYDYDKYGVHEALGEIYYELKKLIRRDNDETRRDDQLSSKGDVISIRDWVDNTNVYYDIEEPPKSHVEITEEDEKVVQRSASMLFNKYANDEEEEEEDEEIYYGDDGDNDEIDEDEDQLNIPNPLDIATDMPKEHIIRRIEIKKNLQTLPNSRSSYGEILISLDYSIRSRSLNVTIVKARNMIDPTRRALVPYCTLRHLFISNEREKTMSTHHSSYRFYTDSPVWNEVFPLKVAPKKLKQTAVEIQVFHSTNESKFTDEQLGLIRLGLKTYPAQKAHYVEFLSNIGRPTAQWHLIRV